MIYLKQKDSEKIPIPVGYEHLPDFYFCYGYIGHNFKEYNEYKGQPKEELP